MFNFLTEVIPEDVANQANDIGTKATTFINEYIDKGVAFLKSMPWYVEAIILLAAALLILIGFFRLFKKLWKFVLIVALIAVAGAAVYFFVVLKGDINSLKSMFQCINLLSYLL